MASTGNIQIGEPDEPSSRAGVSLLFSLKEARLGHCPRQGVTTFMETEGENPNNWVYRRHARVEEEGRDDGAVDVMDDL